MDGITKEEEPFSKTSKPKTSQTDTQPPHQQSTFWLWVLCLLGVDYFSTLSYQTSITYHVAGPLGPFATVLIIAVTLLVILPLYMYMARQSPHGEGSIAVLERLVSGWVGKTLILILLGFAATDFLMLRSISLSDAAQHLTHNPVVAGQNSLDQLAASGKILSQEYLGEWAVPYVSEQVMVSLLLGVIGFGFWYLMRNGFNQKVMVLSVPLVGLYLLVNGVVIGSGLWYLVDHPGLFNLWWQQVQGYMENSTSVSWLGTGWPAILLVSLVLLPQLSLGFSGFEMSMILMPQVRGGKKDDPLHPRGRIRNTRLILFLAALLMSVYLLGAVVVTTLLIPAEQFAAGGLAGHRALAYLAHGGGLVNGVDPAEVNPLCGSVFGSLYDISAILILCFAGSSVMAALAVLLPRILLRFGMELQWVHRFGLMFLWFALINLGITVLFQASVEHQRGAYATGVLALFFATAAAAVGVWWQRRRKPQRFWRFPWYFGLTALLFLGMLLTVVVTSPSGLLISLLFIGAILASSVVSRALRSDEMRTVGFDFVNEHARFLWDSLRLADFPVLVPHRPGLHARLEKDRMIREDHQLDPDTEIVFLEVAVDDPSNFYQRLMIDIVHEDRNYVIKVTQCVSVAHAIASIALEMSRHSKPPGLHFGWSEMDLLAASWSYLAFGEGNVPWKVRELILQAESDPTRRPRVVIG